MAENAAIMYKILGLDLTRVITSDDKKDIRRKYRDQMRKCHPDKFDHTMFVDADEATEWSTKVNKAYESLRDADDNE